MSQFRCPICEGTRSKLVAQVGRHTYVFCEDCRSISIDREALDRMDAGEPLIAYSDAYWASELPDARERSFGPALARMAEAVLYSRVPIWRFLDIGTGPGYFLDAVARLLPSKRDAFFGVEKFPPPKEHRTTSPNYLVGDLSSVPFKVDGGICIEVIEHLTPRMVRQLLLELAEVSAPGALYIFNTGMPQYVFDTDLGYLDPTRRGHVMSYSLESMAILCKGTELRPHRIIGKSWAFVLEVAGPSMEEDIRARVWKPLPENAALLVDPEMGSVLQLLGVETSRH